MTNNVQEDGGLPLKRPLRLRTREVHLHAAKLVSAPATAAWVGGGRGGLDGRGRCARVGHREGEGS